MNSNFCLKKTNLGEVKPKLKWGANMGYQKSGGKNGKKSHWIDDRWNEWDLSIEELVKNEDIVTR